VKILLKTRKDQTIIDVLRDRILYRQEILVEIGEGHGRGREHNRAEYDQGQRYAD
jgi:hypothetical protein